MNNLFSILDIPDGIVYGILTGALAGGCISQLLYGRVRPLAVSLGVLGGYLFRETESERTLAGSVDPAYSPNF